MRLTPVIAVLAVAVTACGSTDDAHGGHDTATPGGGTSRTIAIDMQDSKYLPDTIEVADGETVRLVFTNKGEAIHDAFIGDEAAQDDHEMEMNGEMGGHGMADAHAISVDPGDTAELTYTFAAGDGVLVGCHEPGHYDGGMRLTVDIA